MFGYNAVQFVGSIVTAMIALVVFYAMARHSSTPAAKKALLLGLLLVVLFVTMADSCDTTGEPIVLHDGGTITGLDDAIEAEVDQVLDFGDDAVEAARDALEEVVEWSIELDEATNDDADDDADDLSDLHGIGNFTDRSTQ